MKPEEMLKMLMAHDSSTQAGANSLAEKIIPLLRKTHSVKIFNFKNYKSVYASIKNNFKPKVLFLGHLDTVDAKGWKDYKPLSLTKKGKNAYGLGVYDMKAGISAMLHLANNFPSKNIAYLFVTDEELGGFNGAAKIAGHAAPEIVIALEPTEFKIEVAAKGVLNLKITSKGLSAHSSTPEKGVNAIEQMSSFISEVKKDRLFGKKNKLLGKTTIAQVIIKCPNSRGNQIPDYCESNINIRYIPEQNQGQIIKVFRKIAKRYKRKISGIIVEETGSYGLPVICDKNNKYARVLAECISKETGRADYKGNPGASDCRFFAEKKIPSTCFGAMGGNIHAPNEWLDLKSYVKYVKILEDFVRRIK